MTYSFTGHALMTLDRVRVDAYRRALRAVVKPGDVVVDLGAGAGIMTLFACELGASKVWAIEPAAASTLARDAVAANGFAGRVEVIAAHSQGVDPPERVDVIVSDLRGQLPLFGRHLPALADARDRWLKPSGTMVASADRLRVAIAEHVGTAERLSPTALGGEVYGLDLRALREVAASSLIPVKTDDIPILTPACTWAEIDYSRVSDWDLEAAVELEADRAGTGSGFLLWFDSTLAPGVELSNAPGAAPALYGRMLLPWPEPLELRDRERVRVSIEARLCGDEYLWRVTSSSPERRWEPFSQSTLASSGVTAEALRLRSPGRALECTREVVVDRLVLSLVDGRRIPAEIARAVRSAHPDVFRDEQDALDHVLRVVARTRA